MAWETFNFGTEGEPVVVMDVFSGRAEALRADAATKTFGFGGRNYPGVRAARDPGYLAPMAERLESVVRDVFGVSSGLKLVDCADSLVTTPPEALTPVQRLPHFDGLEAGRLALLHYLTDQGGTAFFRHLPTGYETVTADRYPVYRAALDAGTDVPRGYFHDDTDQFTRIGHIDAVVDRAILYRSATLHSGIVPKILSNDPAKGRLTINTFFDVR